jgi:nuclear transport factor 2 (NTF2) superfamily protein
MMLETAQEARSSNPTTEEEARAFVNRVASLFMPWNIEALVEGFTHDCVVRFGSLPEFRGREALRDFFCARRAKQSGYRLQKHFRVLSNDTLTNVWEGEWLDAETGVPMRGFGVEVWVLREGKIARWEAAFNAARADQAGGVSQLLG